MANSYDQVMAKFDLRRCGPRRRSNANPTGQPAFAKQDPASIDSVLQDYETRIGWKLPINLVGFLKDFGFCVFRARAGDVFFPDPAFPSDDGIMVEKLYGIDPDYSDSVDISAVCKRLHERPGGYFVPANTSKPGTVDEFFAERLPKRCLPIASSPGGHIVMSLSGEDEGCIYYFCLDNNRLKLLAKSFDDFLGGLYLKKK